MSWPSLVRFFVIAIVVVVADFADYRTALIRSSISMSVHAMCVPLYVLHGSLGAKGVNWLLVGNDVVLFAVAMLLIRLGQRAQQCRPHRL